MVSILIKIQVPQAALSRNLASVCLSVPNTVATTHRRTINYVVCTKDALPRLYCDLSAEAKIIVSLLSILVVPLTIRPESPYLAPGDCSRVDSILFSNDSVILIALAGTVGHLVYRYRRALEEDPNEYQDPNEVIVPRPLLPALPIPLPLFQNCGNLAPAIESAAFPLNHSPIPSLSPKASPPTFSRTTVQAHALPKLLRWTYKEAGTFPLPPLKATPPIPLLPAASPARLIHGPPKVLRTEFEDAEALFGDKKGSNTREMW
ncbi:hypothetical protein C8R43DRAFT_680326 [Mycena crocata]|nr:hypothetical protein C8R43DRAFT_680326 [Mycena crocata]